MWRGEKALLIIIIVVSGLVAAGVAYHYAPSMGKPGRGAWTETHAPTTTPASTTTTRASSTHTTTSRQATTTTTTTTAPPTTTSTTTTTHTTTPHDTTPPAINFVSYEFLPPSKVSVSVYATDDSGVAKVIAEVQGRNYTLSLVKGLFTSNVSVGDISKINRLPIKVFAFDKYNNYAIEEVVAIPTLEEKFVSFALNNNISKDAAEEFYKSYTGLVQDLYPKDNKLLLPPLKLYSINGSVFSLLYNLDMKDKQITMDRNKIVSLESQLFLDLGYTGKVKVLVPGSNSYVEKGMSKRLIEFGGNYSIALYQLGLPKHNKSVIWLAGNATEINPVIVDFKPIMLKDFQGNSFVIQSENIARDIWMLVEHLKYTPYVVKYPEMYEAFNVKVKQNAWDILDNPVIHELGEHYEPTDKVIWETVIIPEWNYYWNSTPQAGNLSKRITVFPWYNSSLLKQWIANDTDRKIALMYFWKIPIGDEIHGIADLDAYLQNKTIVYHKGLDAMQYVIEQMPRVYEDVMSKYPNGKLYGKDVRFWYYSWLGDRQVHGLNNGIKQFAGDIHGNWTDLKKDPSIMLKYNTIDTYLTKNFSYWDLIKFVYGYGVANYGGDNMKYDNLYTPIAFKAFGIPHNNRGVYYEHYINAPARYAAGPEDVIFGLPDHVLQPLKQGKYNEVLIFPGNGISCIGSPLYGIKEDLEYGSQHPVEPNAKYIEMYLPLRGDMIYLFKGGQKG